MRIAIVGLGKLGAVMAAVLADRGHEVVGADLDPRVVAAVNAGCAPVREPDLAELIARNRSRLRATQSTRDAARQAEIVFIVTPTPSGPDGTFSLKHVLAAAQEVSAVLKEVNTFKIVAVTSTVMPEATGGQILPALESGSGKKCGVDFGLCYNPEFIALGSVARDFLNPDIVLIGESDPKSGQVLENLYRGVCANSPVVVRTNFINAEIIKLSLNTFVTTKISYANMLAEICERLPGADVDVVTRALGCDRRIGGSYLRGGLGYGGPCFPRDNVALGVMARRLGVDPALAEATDRINRRQALRVGRLVAERVRTGGLVAVLGLAYKAGTSVAEESQGVLIAEYLAECGLRVSVFDPAAMAAARERLGERVRFSDALEECVAGAEAVVIATPWPEFRGLDPSTLAGGERRPLIIDCWRLLPPEALRGRAEVWVLGRGGQGCGRA
jgi:UDPglucose 6-dehydrogenase